VSWRWYTAAVAGEIQTRDLMILSPALYKTANSVTYYQHLSSVLISQQHLPISVACLTEGDCLNSFCRSCSSSSITLFSFLRRSTRRCKTTGLGFIIGNFSKFSVVPGMYTTRLQLPDNRLLNSTHVIPYGIWPW